MPQDSTIPNAVDNFELYASFQTVMFVFDNSTDLDIATYEYRLYEENQVVPDPANPGYYKLINGATINSGSVVPYSQGFNTANVFTVAVENSTTTSATSTTSPVSYYGAVRTVDTSSNVSPWSLITKTSTDTPLIDEQFIGGLTAAKITAGEIGAAEITLAGANSIIKSSTYDFENELTTSGWYIRGDGHFSLGGANGITYDNETIVIGEDVQVEANFAADSISVGGVTKLNINNAIGSGVGGMTVGDPTYNYWYANGLFSVGSNSKYFRWDGTNISTTGTIITGATVSGGTVGGISTSTNKLFIGTGTYNNTNTAFYVDNNGNFSLKDKLSWDGTTLTINGGGTFSGTLVVGDVEIGNDVGPGAGHYGISLSTSNFNNIFLRRNDGVYFFRVGNGGANSITWDSSSGVLNVTGAITATSGTFNGRLQAGDIYIPNTSSPVFSVTSAGTVTATSGTIGGFTLASTTLSATSGSTGFGDYASIVINSNGLIDSYFQNIGIFGSFSENVKINNYAAGGNGAINVTGTASGSFSERWYTSYGVYNPSDIRLKNIIEEEVNALSLIENIQTTKFVFKKDETERQHFGFIAQQMNEHIPYVAIPGGEDPDRQPWGIVQENLIPYLVKSIQQLSQKVDALESRLV